ncbi:MAG: sugar transferase [Chloroflexota bacterium]
MSKTSPRISVIVPVKDDAENLARCLEALGKQEKVAGDYEVIVIDDGSQDSTPEVAASYGVKYWKQETAGPAVARNLGAKHARGDILAFTDSDCVPTPEWLFHLTKRFDELDVVGTKGTYRTEQRSLVARFVQQEYEFKYARMASQTSIDFIDTYSAAYRCNVFLNNQGFQTAFPVPSVEDQELSFRLARKGYKLCFVPEAVVYHQHDCMLWEYCRRKFGIGYWKAFLLRWLPEKTFYDTHTPPHQRWQIGILALTLASLVLVWAWQPLIWFALAGMVVFFLTAIQMLGKIVCNDPGVLVIAPGLIILRAASLGSGLLWGMICPPKVPTPEVIGLSAVALLFKRMLDVSGAFLGLCLSVPLIGLLAILIKLDTPGPVFIIQERIGENGKPFKFIKLRTMVSEAEHLVHQVIKDSPLSGPVFKVPNDPRVTRTGRFLRRWSLDELPQFWNVLIGDMSLVGPRPEEGWVVAQYNDQHRQRLVVKPGLTGPMQISGRGELDMDARLELELDYIRNYSLWKDLSILLRTLPAVISGKGAF